MLVPLYGFLEGDTMGLLILAHDDQTLTEVARKLCDMSRLRAAPEGELCVVFEGQMPAMNLTVAAAGLTALCRIDVRRRPA